MNFGEGDPSSGQFRGPRVPSEGFVGGRFGGRDDFGVGFWGQGLGLGSLRGLG